MLKVKSNKEVSEEKPVVLLNWLPPVQTHVPSMPLSVLKAFLAENKIPAKIIYWNLLLESLYKKYFAKEQYMESGRLLPFASLLNQEACSADLEMRIHNQVNTLAPLYKYNLQHEYLQAFERLKIKIKETVVRRLEKIDFNSVKIFAFSQQYYQWIPGLIFSKIVKQKNKDIKIVVGGFSSKQDCTELMQYSDLIDFAIWGEGEYPLMELTAALCSGKSDYDSIAGLAYKSGENNILISKEKRKYIELKNYIPDFSDYFEDPQVKPFLEKSIDNKIELLLNSIRGCIWNRCKFCVLNHGYRYRELLPEEIVKIISFYIEKYNIYKFRFVDNDIVGRSRDRFFKLLDLLFDLSVAQGKTLRIFAEIIPKNMTAEGIKKIKASGISSVQIGFEALTDGLLKKMNKQIRLADSILFIKFALKYDIEVIGANIIRGLPGEDLRDVYESFENIHFFRFFIGKGPQKMQLSLSQLALYPGTPFHKESEETDRVKWNHNSILNLINADGCSNMNFGMSRFDFPNKYEWDKFESYYSHYEKNNCSYSIIKNKETVVYKEYVSGKAVNTIIFDDPIYWDVLKCANHEIRTYEQIETHIKTLYPAATNKKIREILESLKDEYLLYYNNDLSQVVTVIDTSMENA